MDSPLLKQFLTLEHIKPRLLGHCGAMPDLILFMSAGLKRHLHHSGSRWLDLVANTCLKGIYNEIYQNVAGMKKLFKPENFRYIKVATI